MKFEMKVQITKQQDLGAADDDARLENSVLLQQSIKSNQ